MIIYSHFPDFLYKRGKGMENQANTLCVKDLYEGAYLLCMGFHLKKLTIVAPGGASRKRKAVFVITGDGIEEKAESYRMGQATVNVAMLKFTLEKLKDAMFAKIRAEESTNAKARAQRTGTRGNYHESNRSYQTAN